MSKLGQKLRGTLLDPEWIWRKQQFRSITRLAQGLSGVLLDVGCGDKMYQAALPVDRITHYFGLEYPDVFEGTKVSQLGATADIWADGRMMPIASESLDAILCVNVFEHTEEPELILAEMCRVLKPTGNLLLVAPQEYRLHMEPHDYWRWMVPGMMLVLERNGFKVMVHEPVCSFWTMLAYNFSAGCYHKLILPLLKGITSPIGVVLFAFLQPAFIFCQLIAVLLDTILPYRNHALVNVYLAEKKAN